MISGGKTDHALDASALLAVLLDEPGNEKVHPILDRAYIHSVNAAEVVAKLIGRGVSGLRASQMIEELDIGIDEELSARHAALCGELIANTRQQGFSLGDCVCLTMAASVGAIAVTADRRWQDLHGRQIGDYEIRVQVIR